MGRREKVAKVGGVDKLLIVTSALTTIRFIVTKEDEYDQGELKGAGHDLYRPPRPKSE